MSRKGLPGQDVPSDRSRVNREAQGTAQRPAPHPARPLESEEAFGRTKAFSSSCGDETPQMLVGHTTNTTKTVARKTGSYRGKSDFGVLRSRPSPLLQRAIQIVRLTSRDPT